MKCFALLLFAGLPGCLDAAAIDEVFCDPGEACEALTSGETCPSGTLGYDPARTDGEAVPPDPKVTAVAVRLAPFAKDTTCKTIVVGFATTDGCAVPGKGLSLLAFDAAGEVPKDVPPGGTIANIGASPDITRPSPSAGISEVRFPIPTTHKAGAYPFVGVAMGGDGICPAGFESTCGGAVSLDVHGAWRAVEGEGYYLGLADCGP